MTMEKETASPRMSLDKYALLRDGVVVHKMLSTKRLLSLIRRLRPVRTKLRLARIGSVHDGGYLVPEDMDGITACFSPGVDVNASFETDLLQRFGINSHLADRSVDGPPQSFVPKSFLKKFIGAYDDDTFITMDSWTRAHPEFAQEGDFLLQMDIEGGEYASLLSISEELLLRFRIMVIEFHNIESWCNPHYFDLVETVFSKLLKHFHVVHNHPNNCCGLVNMGGIVAPRVFELTFLRRDRATPLGFCDAFPHPLDRPNLEDRQDVALPAIWYREMKR